LCGDLTGAGFVTSEKRPTAAFEDLAGLPSGGAVVCHGCSYLMMLAAELFDDHDQLVILLDRTFAD
jgi:hypothetical protein